VAGVLGSLALIPGLPHLPFFVIAVLVGGVGLTLKRSADRAESDARQRDEAAAAAPRSELNSPDQVRGALTLDVLELEIGYGLIPLVDESEGGELLRRVSLVRRQMAAELGLVLAPIRIRDNVQLASHAYSVKLKGSEIARNELQPGSLLAMNPGDADPSLEGVPTTEPAFGLPALWIPEAARARAEAFGYTVVDPASVIITHLTEVIRKHADELCSRQDTKLLLDGLREQHPAPVDELVPDLMTIGEVHRVLCGLLAEGVSVRDIVTIVETLGDKARVTKDSALLVEYCRQALARQITAGLVGPTGELSVLTLDGSLEGELGDAVVQTPDGSYLGLEPGRANEICQAVNHQLERAATLGLRPAVLCSARVRRHLKALTVHAAPRLTVLSYNEIVPTVHVETVGVIATGVAVA
jgi:flagellar biosynthesis protein FlhA